MQYVYTEELEINPLYHLGFKNILECFKTVDVTEKEQPIL